MPQHWLDDVDEGDERYGNNRYATDSDYDTKRGKKSSSLIIDASNKSSLIKKGEPTVAGNLVKEAVKDLPKDK